MHHFTTMAFLSMTAALVGAQVAFNHTINAFTCPSTGGSFCAGPSLSTNIIIRCEGGVGQPGNCNDNLAGIPPRGVKNFAPCYEPSPTSGHAACSYNNIAYPDTGSPFPIPGTSNTSTAHASATTSFINSSNTSNHPAKITVGFIHMPHASPPTNCSISIPAGATPSVSGVAKQYVPNLGLNDTTPFGPIMSFTNAVGTGLAIASMPASTFTGGVGKMVAGAWAVGAAIFGGMIVFA